MGPARNAGSSSFATGRNHSVISGVWRFVRALIRDEQGQDLVEYALLGAFVAIATIAGLKAIEAAVGSEYLKWDQDEQDLWRPPDP